jgi:hypothetical protein
MKWHQDVFTWRLSIPTWEADVDGLAYPCTSLWLITVSWWDMTYLPGVVLSCRRDRRWSLSRERKLHRCQYLMESLSSSLPVLWNIIHGKSFLPSSAYPLAESWCYLGVYPRSSGVRQRWDGFHTRVCIVRRAWAPTTTSFHTKRLRPTLLESQRGRCLSTEGGSWVCLSGGSGPCPGSPGENG